MKKGHGNKFEMKYTIKKNKCNLFEKAIWIRDPQQDLHTVSEFICRFELTEKIISAQLHIAACGFFQSFLNGKATDGEYFKPILTDFASRKQIRLADEFSGGVKTLTRYSYNVTEMLCPGRNVLTVLLGTGYYANFEKTDLDPSFCYGEPQLLFELSVRYVSGREESFVSDAHCTVRKSNRKSLMFGGDFIDFTAQSDEERQAAPAPAYRGKLIPPKFPADRIMSVYPPASSSHTERGILYDFRINHSGGLRLKIRGQRNTRVTIYYAEILDASGNLDLETSTWYGYDPNGKQVRAVEQKSELILSGGIDVFEPLFCFRCYRYAEICIDGAAEVLDIQSLFICSPVQRNGSFCQSVGELNDFIEMYAHTQLCNYHCAVPLDCPHREKLPYTGDGWLTMESALYFFDAEQFYSKWLDDILQAQGKSGFVPYTAPYMGGGGGYAWGNAIAEVPVLLYRYTGNIQYIRRAYGGVLRWLEYYRGQSDEQGRIFKTEETWLLGDWLSPDCNRFNIVFMNMLCRYRALQLAKTMSGWLGDRRETLLLAELRQLKKQINDCFYNADSHNYLSGRQGENILPVAYGVAEQKELPYILENIRRLYSEELLAHPDTGIIATPLLFQVLTEHNMQGLAYALLTQKTYPSFFAMTAGESTLREHWSLFFPVYDNGNGKITDDKKKISHCHPMFGAVAAWICKKVIGLDLSCLYRREIVFSPMLYENIPYASGCKILKEGPVAVEYERKEKLYLKLEIPPGYTGICKLVSAGTVRIIGNDRSFEQKVNEAAEIRLKSGVWSLEAELPRVEKRREEDAETGYRQIYHFG